jgi:hypothetical protein
MSHHEYMHYSLGLLVDYESTYRVQIKNWYISLITLVN